MVQLFFTQSDGPVFFTNLLRLEATFVIPQRAAPFLLGTSAQVLRPKPKNRPPMVLHPKPPNPLASSVLHTRPPLLDTCHRRPRPPGRQVIQSLRSTCTSAVLTWSTRSLLHVHLCLSMSPGVTTVAGPLALRSLSPSLTSALHRSRSIGTTRLYLTFTSPSTTASELHTCEAKRHVAQPNSRPG